MSPSAALAAPPELRVVRLRDTRPSPVPPLPAWVPLERRDALLLPLPGIEDLRERPDLGLPWHVQSPLAVCPPEDREPPADPALHLLPDAREWAPRIMLHVAETAAGYRRVDHLARYVTPDVLARVARRHALATRRRMPGGQVRLRLVRTQSPDAGVVEVATVIQQGRVTRALAARLSGVRGRWVMTVLELG